MAVQYSQLINKNGTIYNTATGKAYSTPDQLAADLGVKSTSIQWSSIQSNPNYNPPLTVTQAQPNQTITGVKQAPGGTISGVTTAQPGTISGVSNTPVGSNYNPQGAAAPGSTIQAPAKIGTLYPGSTSAGQTIQPAGSYGGQGQQTYTLGDGNTYDQSGNLISSGGSGSGTGGDYSGGAGGSSGGGGGGQSGPNTPPPPGVDPALWNQLTAGDKAFVDALNGLAKNTYDAGAANFSINAKTLADALTAAQNDPDIKAKYGDAAIMAAADLNNNLGYINAEYAQQMGLLTKEQALARKTLTETEAAAGRAYSGFRTQAQNLLQQQQSGIIESSKRTLQQNVRQAGTQYESQYGTAALSKLGFPIVAGGETYAPYGGITGSVPLAEKADVQSKQQQIYSAEVNPLTQ